MVCAFFIIFVSAKSFSFQLIIFSFKFMYIDTHSHIYEEDSEKTGKLSYNVPERRE